MPNVEFQNEFYTDSLEQYCHIHEIFIQNNEYTKRFVRITDMACGIETKKTCFLSHVE